MIKTNASTASTTNGAQKLQLQREKVRTLTLKVSSGIQSGTSSSGGAFRPSGP